jgi:DNA-binding NtrC family response regulator
MARPLLALVVEDDDLIRDALVRELNAWGAQTLEATTESRAIELLDRLPDLIILDIRLADGGSGVEVARRAAARFPRPIVLAITAAASAAEAFRLGSLGVAGLLEKPLELTTFTATVEAYLAACPELPPELALQVGRVDYASVLEQARRALLSQALARTGGNKMAAARLLNVSRQAVQQMMKDFEFPSGSSTTRRSGEGG